MASIRTLYAAAQAKKAGLLRQRHFQAANGELMEKVRREAAVIDAEQARQLATELGVDLQGIDGKEGLLWWRYGIALELEHGTKLSAQTNVTNDDLQTTARIALAHIREFPDYYQRLAIMENRAEAYWQGKRG